VGHIYYFLIEVLPNSHNIDIIHTQFCVHLVSYATGMSPPPTRPAMPGFGNNNVNYNHPVQNFANLGGGYNWGQGRQLGGR
jgi:hypothetical protein